MALSIDSAEADRLARELADLTGESITEAVVVSLESRLDVERRRQRSASISDVADRFQELPVFDRRAPDDIMGYGEHGLPV